MREITMQAAAQAECIQQTKANARQSVDETRTGKDSDYGQSVQANNEEQKGNLATT